MPAPQIVCLRGDGPPRYCYRIAGRSLLSDSPLPELEAFQTLLEPEPGRLAAPPIGSGTGEITFQGEAWVAGGFAFVHCSRWGWGYDILVADVGRYRVAADGQFIWWEPDRGADTQAEQQRQALLGPALVLALALQGMWCLHGAAALVRERLVLLLGASGAGKSTLAYHLARGPYSRHVADDVIPISHSAGQTRVWPRFPQLKLAQVIQPGTELDEPLQVRSIIVVEAAAGDVALVAPQPGEAGLSLVRHSVGARLFDRELLAQHLRFAAAAASSVPVWRLAYPHRPTVLPRIMALIRDELI